MKRWIAMLMMAGVAVAGGQDGKVSKDRNTAAEKPSVQRFLPLQPDHSATSGPWYGFFALDTKTGVLCKTVNVEYPYAGTNMKDIPLCRRLYDEDR